ncbi:MAG: hypothetical protein LBT47_00980 [Deltaproteobacteria bacterium]|nr:hypothetical protein [Deltaproteobacteria bacterium]
MTEIHVLEDRDRDGGYYAYEIESPTNPALRVPLTFQNGPWREVGVNGIFEVDLLVIARDKLERSLPEDPEKRGYTKEAIRNITLAIDNLMSRYQHREKGETP